jgi:hypothetical protein
MSPDEEAEVLRLMRQARQKDREYASFFGWAIDRDLEELGVVRALAESLEADKALFFDSLKIRGRGQDPPDVEGVSHGDRRIAFEVTELVDGSAIEAFKAGRLYDYADWNQDKFLDALHGRLNAKVEKRLTLKGGPYDGGYFIVVHTDEPLLSAETVGRFLNGQRFPELSGVARSFLLLSYDPRLEKCPYFELAADA